MKSFHLLDKTVDEVIALRRILHKSPALSGKELPTQQLIKQFLKKKLQDCSISEIAGTGLIADFKFFEEGKTIVIRADIDALPIPEEQIFFYASCIKGVSHKCGHDGHAAILAGLAVLLQENPFNCGRVILLFQPAEEIGTGAKEVLKDPYFKDLSVDFVFGFHNLPGFEKGQIVIAPKYFASASKGMSIRLSGTPAHAAYPESGKSPASAMAEIINELSTITELNDRYDNFVMLTIVHAQLGERAFGTAPGEAEICATLRSYDNTNMLKLCYDASLSAREIADEFRLKILIEYEDEFDATINHVEACKIIDDAADICAFPKTYITEPFRWSEDFGQFTSAYCGAMFGIGAGKTHPDLHTANYDFPDDIIANAITMLYAIINEGLHNQ